MSEDPNKSASWVHEAMRKLTSDSRSEKKRREIERRRFADAEDDAELNGKSLNLEDVLLKLKTSKYGDRKSLEWLKTSLANESVTAEQVFRSTDGTNHIHGLVNVLTGRHRQDAALQLLAGNSKRVIKFHLIDFSAHVSKAEIFFQLKHMYNKSEKNQKMQLN